MPRSFLSLLGTVAAIVISIAAASTSAAAFDGTSRGAQPVPSLAPADTQRLWRRLVSRPSVAMLQSAECRPLRVVLYAPTDWLRLATKLASSASPCAEYYISVPPLVSDKTQPRADQAWRIRALGRSFHALAEISVTGWSSWVAATGSSWYAAGVEARRRMATAGYDVAAGDSWALNELSSAVRQGSGNARANMQAFLHGLHDADGTLPQSRGAVFVIGLAQSTGDLSVYQARLQDWYEDPAFWNDVSRYTSDWSQELYGDIRAYAAPGAPREARRDALNEYLQHPATLAAVAPTAAAAAATYLTAAYSPLANAAWQYDAAFGWTNVPPELMQDYVSAQVYAMRAAGNSRFGFAWSPRNLAGVSASEFAAQTDALLVRLAEAIRDSDQVPEGACGTSWCTRELDGAALTSAWRTFSEWKPSRLAFTAGPATLPAATPSPPLTIELQTSNGLAYAAGLPVTVAVSSSSPTGEFATSVEGPWTNALTTHVLAGATGTSFYFRDAAGGTTDITAAAAGKTAAVQTVVVATPPEPTPAPAPAPAPAQSSPVGGAAGSDVVESSDVKPPPQSAVAPPAAAAPSLRVLAATSPRITRRAGTATVLVRFRVSDAVRLHARVTAAHSTRGVTLLPGTRLAQVRSTATRAALSAAVSAPGTYVFLARLRSSSLRGGRVYLVRLRAVDAGGQLRTVTIRLRA